MILKIIHEKSHWDVKGLTIQLVEIAGEARPFRVRLIDNKTGEVGPNISIHETISSAAIHYDGGGPTW